MITASFRSSHSLAALLTLQRLILPPDSYVRGAWVGACMDHNITVQMHGCLYWNIFQRPAWAFHIHSADKCTRDHSPGHVDSGKPGCDDSLAGASQGQVTHLPCLCRDQCQWHWSMIRGPALRRSPQGRRQPGRGEGVCIAQSQSLPHLDKPRFFSSQLLQSPRDLWSESLECMRVLVICAL